VRYRALLSPARPTLAWILISHKLLRYVVPYCAGAALLSLYASGLKLAAAGAADHAAPNLRDSVA